MKIIAGIILAFLLGAMFVSLFNMSAGMDMSGGMLGCPFMSHEEVVCPMNLADHIDAWKSAFLFVAPTIFLLFTAVGVVALILSIAPHLLPPKRKPIPIQFRLLLKHTHAFSYKPLQDLFARGVLHPKLF